jgi:hypothetical protein
LGTQYLIIQTNQPSGTGSQLILGMFPRIYAGQKEVILARDNYSFSKRQKELAKKKKKEAKRQSKLDKKADSLNDQVDEQVDDQVDAQVDDQGETPNQS